MNENHFLTALFQRLPAAVPPVIVGPGDDCAALTYTEDTLLLAAVDQIVGGRHYYDEGESTTAVELAGRKLLARNLSDIAAMGGTPTFCLLALALGQKQGRAEEQWFELFFDGLLTLANQNNVQLIGGDLAASPNDDIGSLTILGTVPAEQICRREGAVAGDHLFATGYFGDSLESGHHLHFTPRCREGRWLAANFPPRAMIDVSDGLLLDAWRLAKASKVSLQLDLAGIPLRNPQRTIQQAISDGEDYELLFAVQPEQSDTLIDNWPFEETALTRIGYCTAINNTPDITDLAGQSLYGKFNPGYDHWRQ